MKHLDLFSGIGGFALAASWVWGAEHEIHSFVEIEPFCQRVLKKHWPLVPIHSDIREYEHDGTAIDLLTGGFPCQPYSQAGQQRGAEDDRALWPAMLEVIKESKPTWIIGENVAGSINMVVDQATSDLEQLGYEARPFDIPACAIGAVHERRRIFLIAHDNSQRREGGWQEKICWEQRIPWGENERRTPDFIRRPHLHSPKLCRGGYGIRERLDAIGNAIVPQVVVPIMQAIKQLDKQSA